MLEKIKRILRKENLKKTTALIHLYGVRVVGVIMILFVSNLLSQGLYKRTSWDIFLKLKCLLDVICYALVLPVNLFFLFVLVWGLWIKEQEK